MSNEISIKDEARNLLSLLLVHHSVDTEEYALLMEALAQPVQEPVVCRFCHSKKGCWTWQCYNCGEIDDVQQPAPLPVQEPVAWDKPSNSFNEWWNGDYDGSANPYDPDSKAHWAWAGWKAAQTVQEPVAWLYPEGLEALQNGKCWTAYPTEHEDCNIPLYTASPQRPWVGLTEFQFAEIYNKWNDSNGSTPWGLNQALEAKLKELNK